MKNKIIIFLFSLCLNASLFAQAGVEFKGKLVNKLGYPISGALVKVVNQVDNIAATDKDGNFVINANNGDKLEITTADFSKQIVEVQGPEKTIVLKFESQSVDAGVSKLQSLSESTGAISKSTIDEVDNRSAMNLANSLFGNALGLTALQNSDMVWGSPANFSIRGNQTLSNNNILILVDGFERSLNNLTMEEVESVSVLRDASAVALYGFKGINGVLSVKTKRGKNQTREIKVTYDHAFTSQKRLPEFVNSFDYATAMNEALVNDGRTARYSQNELNAFKSQNYPYLYPNVNWVNEVFRENGSSNIYNVSFRGGGMRMKYFTSVNLQNNSGFLNESDLYNYSTQNKFSKANIRTNLDIQLTNTTTLEVGMQGLLSEFSRPGLGSDNLIGYLYTVPSAAYPIKTYDGVWGGNSTWGTNTNPVALAQDRGFSKGHNRALYADAKLTQDLSSIVEGLKASVRLGYDNWAAYWEGSTKGYEWASDAVNMSTGTPRDTIRTKGGATGNLGYDSKLDYQERHFNAVATVDYSKQIGIHSFDASVFYNFEKTSQNNRYNTINRQNIGAYLHYGLDNKYFADVILMSSGSSRLAPKHKYAFSPTLGLAWDISKEEFLKENKYINFLKLRGSAGIINADFIPTNNYWSQEFVGGNGYPLGNNASWYDGTRENWLPVQDIRNERAIKYNVGIDAALINSLSFSFDAFYENRNNIFVSAQNNVSAVLGNYPSFVNAGEVKSWGFETGANYEKKINDFVFNVGGKFTLAKNEIVEQLEEPRAYDYLKRTGHSVGQIFGLEAIGFFVDAEDIANSPTQQFSYTRPGDLKYKDQNNDGIIDSNDEIAMGYNTSIPEIYYSFNLGAEWKGVGFNATFQGVGNYSAMLNTQSMYVPLIGNTTISQEYFDNRWTPLTANTAIYPRLTTESNANNYRNNTVWLADRSFLKLRNVEVYYKLPAFAMVQNAKIYFRGVDLLTVDKIKISDPESYGIAYPLTKSFHVGLTVGF